MMSQYDCAPGDRLICVNDSVAGCRSSGLMEDSPMKSSVIQEAVSWIRSATGRFRNPVLAGALSRASDDQIDEALKANNMSRADLFRPAHAAAPHRRHMALMLATWGIDIDRATERHWQQLKDAEEKCGRCLNTGRCQRWLEWGRPNTAPNTFCSNAQLWSSIAEEQAAARDIQERG